ADSIGRQLLHLQRTAGNHAVQELVMQARGPGIALIMRPPSTVSPGGRSIQPSGQPAVQRVGGAKIGLEYLPQDTDEIKTGEDVQYRTRKWESKAKPAVYVNIAKVKRGTGAFIKKSDPSIGGPAREVFRKIGIKRGLNIPTEKKEYIRDDRGTLTRRYAYVEK